MPQPLAQYLDFADHKASATPADIKLLCQNVIEHGFHAAFVNAAYISLAKETIRRLPAGRQVRVGTVVSFPLGQDTVAAKMAAANEAVQLGADELDVVPNVGTFLSGDAQGFENEMKSIVDSARMVGKPVIVKFILDPGYVTNDQLAAAAKLVQSAGADFVKIGSGMGPRNPTLEDLKIVKESVPGMKLKVAGGITTYEVAKSFIDAGALRLGTSHAIEIIGRT